MHEHRDHRTKVKKNGSVGPIPTYGQDSCKLSTNARTQAVIEHETPVLVVGAGPAGLIAALQLSKNGARCMLIERNLDTTRWPKMDITNCRSMELLKRLGVDGGLREVGEFLSSGKDATWNNCGAGVREIWEDHRLKLYYDGRCARGLFVRCKLQQWPLGGRASN